jgi:hypothetical protein
MSRIQIKRGLRYVRQKQIYQVKAILEGKRYQVENLASGEEQLLNYEEIFQAWSEGEIQFEVSGYGTRKSH